MKRIPFMQTEYDLASQQSVFNQKAERTQDKAQQNDHQGLRLPAQTAAMDEGIGFRGKAGGERFVKASKADIKEFWPE